MRAASEHVFVRRGRVRDAVDADGEWRDAAQDCAHRRRGAVDEFVWKAPDPAALARAVGPQLYDCVRRLPRAERRPRSRKRRRAVEDHRRRHGRGRAGRGRDAGRDADVCGVVVAADAEPDDGVRRLERRRRRRRKLEDVRVGGGVSRCCNHELQDRRAGGNSGRRPRVGRRRRRRGQRDGSVLGQRSALLGQSDADHDVARRAAAARVGDELEHEARPRSGEDERGRVDDGERRHVRGPRGDAHGRVAVLGREES
mmetsp:Transcript_25024/g.85750  ORF Transcript_25024/g.85750 Transcript_25024/m.85750 type:complete len:256 (-) Transcript_25024:737-1504(-)